MKTICKQSAAFHQQKQVLFYKNPIYLTTKASHYALQCPAMPPEGVNLLGVNLSEATDLKRM